MVGTVALGMGVSASGNSSAGGGGGSAVACTAFDAGGFNGTTASQLTASKTFTAGRFYILTLRTRHNSLSWTSVPWSVGTTGTWTEQVPSGGRVVDPDDAARGSVAFRFACGSTVTGAVSMAVTSGTFSTIEWAIDEFTGSDNGGTNGANAVVQAVGGTVALGGGSPALATLAAFSSVNNATYGSFAYGGGDLTVGSGFTQKSFSHAADGIMTEFKATNDTTVDASFTPGGSRITVIAFELKAL